GGLTRAENSLELPEGSRCGLAHAQLVILTEAERSRRFPGNSLSVGASEQVACNLSRSRIGRWPGSAHRPHLRFARLVPLLLLLIRASVCTNRSSLNKIRRKLWI